MAAKKKVPKKKPTSIEKHASAFFEACDELEVTLKEKKKADATYSTNDMRLAETVIAEMDLLFSEMAKKVKKSK